MASVAAVLISQMLINSQMVVVGQVTAAKIDGYIQNVTVRPVGFIRGDSIKEPFHLSLAVAGMKITEPKLKYGEICVFFLKRNKEGLVELASNGSISCFSANAPLVVDEQGK